MQIAPRSIRRPHRPRRAGRPVAAGLLIAATLAASPLALAATGGPLREGMRNGTTVKETEIIGSIAARPGTGGYVTRQSNVNTGAKAGGAAIYGCRTPVGGTLAGSAPCLRASNLAGGSAFEFATVSGVAGLIAVGDPNVPNPGRPFTTNATGVATGLNADRLDGLNASDLLGKTEQAADSDKLDGREAADFVGKSELLFALVDADVGTASIVRGRGATGATSPGTGRYVVTFERDVTACVATATLADATSGPASNGEISVDQPVGASIEVNTYDSAGAPENPLASDGFSIQVAC